MPCYPSALVVRPPLLSTRLAKKERERVLLATLLRAESIESQIIDRESPDFEICLQGKAVGVEVTELYHGSQAGQPSLQAIASICREIVERSERLFAKSAGTSLRVSVAFSPNAPLQKVRRDEAAQILHELVVHTLREQGTDVEWRPRGSEDLRFLELFSRIHIYRQPQDFTPHWLVITAGWVAPVTAELVQSRINEKASLAASYMQNHPEVWLVVGVRGDTPSQFFDFNTEALGVSFRSPFSRTYFVDAFLGRAVRLRTSP